MAPSTCTPNDGGRLKLCGKGREEEGGDCLNVSVYVDFTPMLLFEDPLLSLPTPPSLPTSPWVTPHQNNPRYQTQRPASGACLANPLSLPAPASPPHPALHPRSPTAKLSNAKAPTSPEGSNTEASLLVWWGKTNAVASSSVLLLARLPFILAYPFTPFPPPPPHT